MKSSFALLACLGLLAASSYAQSASPQHNIEFGAAGLFPLSGWRTADYSPGAGLHAGYEFRPVKHLGAEAGYTAAWLPARVGCNGFGCTYGREPLRFLDYGLRGVAPLGGGRVELSVGVGGGYVWYQYGGGPFGPNATLLQYSGKGAVALDRRQRFRAAFTIRAWRDLGRPTQQWLTTFGGIVLSIGGRP